MFKNKTLFVISLFAAAIIARSANGGDISFKAFVEDSPKFEGLIENIPVGAKPFKVSLPKTPKNFVNANKLCGDELKLNFAKKLNDAVAHCKKTGAKKLVLEKGVYIIKDGSFLLFENLSNFTFDANGSTFVMQGASAKTAVLIKECQQCKFGNFNIDVDWNKTPIASFAKLVNMENSDDSNAPYADFKFIGCKIFQHKNFNMYSATPMNFDTKYGANAKFFFETHAKKIPQWITPNTVRLITRNEDILEAEKFENDQKDVIFRIQHFDKNFNAVKVRNNENFTLENVNIFASFGGGIDIAGKRQKYFQLLNCDIKCPQLAKKRPMTVAKNAITISNTSGFGKLKDCDIELAANNGVEIFDTSAMIFPSGTKSATINAEDCVKAGDIVQLRREDFTNANFDDSEFETKVLKTQWNAMSRNECTFSKQLPKLRSDEKGFLVFNKARNTKNIIIDNCSFTNNGNIAIALAADDTTIVHSFFSTMQKQALNIFSQWNYDGVSKGYCPKNIVVDSCTFENASGSGASDISVNLYRSKKDAIRFSPVIKNILVQNNSFIDSFGFVASFSHSENVTVQRNKILNPTPRKIGIKNRASFLIVNTSDIHIINNSIFDCKSVVEGVYYDEISAADLVLAGNKLLGR